MPENDQPTTAEGTSTELLRAITRCADEARTSQSAATIKVCAEAAESLARARMVVMNP